jgi:UDP-N-acetylmuramoyl-L-alanyl-D-glutamate--2,6-diaminopimelate ligase
VKLAALTGASGPGSDRDILGLALDNRQVQPGFLFAALPGVKVDGARFVPQALEAGAVAVLARPEVSVDPALAVHIADGNPRKRLAQIAATFFARQPRIQVAVTGTNGKTSVADMVRQIWLNCHLSAASLGTLGLIAPGISDETGMTTPDVLTLFRTLARLADVGIDHVAFEASSHGLAQYRIDGVRLSAAGFTNISRDHLDYHATFEDYFYAKARLFGEVLAPSGVAVLNADADYVRELEEICWARGVRTLMVGAAGKHLKLVDRAITASGQTLRLRYQGHVHTVALPLVGAFQASNALVAAGLLLASGLKPSAVWAGLAALQGVPGRLQQAGQTPKGAPVYIDYAHTPDGLRAAIEALRPHTARRLHVVFGCGGDRDPGKRPQMGAIARDLADRVYVTDDNPRSEQPSTIRAAILAACPGAEDIGDRRLAIATAMRDAGAGDLVLVAGKGHETGQIVGSEVLPFNDASVVAALAQELVP